MCLEDKLSENTALLFSNSHYRYYLQPCQKSSAAWMSCVTWR